jgi:hypothetical protein
MAVLASSLATAPAADDETGARFSFWVAAAELGFWATAGGARNCPLKHATRLPVSRRLSHPRKSATHRPAHMVKQRVSFACAAQCNTAALQQIGVVRGTLLLATINVLTPALSALIGTSEAQRNVPLRTWAGCVVALVSTLYALAGDTTVAAASVGLPPTELRLSLGDQTMLGAAFCYATQQVRLSSLVARFPAQRLAAARVNCQAVCSLGFLPFVGAVSAAAPLGDGSSLAVSNAPWAGSDEGVGAALDLIPPVHGASLDVVTTAAHSASLDVMTPRTLDWMAPPASAALEWAAQLSATQLGLLAFSSAVAVVGLLLQFEGQRVVPAACAQPSACKRAP